MELLFVYREFLGQAWMKSDKKFRAEHIIQMTKRFNDGSRLVGSEIVLRLVKICFEEYCLKFLIFVEEQWQREWLRLKNGQL